MKIFINLLVICLFLVSCECNYHEAEKKPYEVSEKQIEFAKLLLDNSVVISADWKDFKNLEVTVKPEKLGRNDENDNDLLYGTLFADTVATKGHKYVDRNICVSVIYPDNKQVGFACVKNE